MHTSNVLEVHLTAERAVHRRRKKKTDTFSAFDIKMTEIFYECSWKIDPIYPMGIKEICGKAHADYVERLLAEFFGIFFRAGYRWNGIWVLKLL